MTGRRTARNPDGRSNVKTNHVGLQSNKIQDFRFSSTTKRLEGQNLKYEAGHWRFFEFPNVRRFLKIAYRSESY